MHAHRNRFVSGIALALAAVSVAAPTGLAAGPDDRPLYRGGTDDLAPASVSPDDRPFSRAGAVDPAPSGGSPDDRPFARTWTEGATPAPPAEVVVQSAGFDWGDALIGATFGLTLALLGARLIVVVHRRRGTLSTA